MSPVVGTAFNAIGAAATSYVFDIATPEAAAAYTITGTAVLATSSVYLGSATPLTIVIDLIAAHLIAKAVTQAVAGVEITTGKAIKLLVGASVFMAALAALDAG